MSWRPPREGPKRGKPVAGTSAKKARAERQTARRVAQWSREEDLAPPDELSAPEDLEELARRARGLPPAEDHGPGSEATGGS